MRKIEEAKRGEKREEMKMEMKIQDEEYIDRMGASCNYKKSFKLHVVEESLAKNARRTSYKGDSYIRTYDID